MLNVFFHSMFFIRVIRNQKSITVIYEQFKS